MRRSVYCAVRAESLNIIQVNFVFEDFIYHLHKGRQKNNSSRCEIHEKNSKYTWTDYKTNTQIAKELKITPILDKLLEYKRNWIQHVSRMSRNRLPRIMKRYSPAGRRNHGRPFRRLLDT